MSTAPLYDGDHVRVSFELFPTRTPRSEAALYRTVAELAALRPDFFSVTYGASGGTRDTSRRLIEHVLETTSVTPLAHLTCVGADREDLADYIASLLRRGVRDFLALRGDPPAGEPNWQPHPGGLGRASELVSLLHEQAAQVVGNERVSVSVATYPGREYDASGRAVVCDNDVAALVEKQAAGADFAITQLFYDAAHYAELVRRAREAGVTIPIVAGVLPLTDPDRLRRMVNLTKVTVPEALLELLDSAPDDGERYRRGVAASAKLVNEVIEAGAPGIHLYTFNSSRPVADILYATGLRDLVSGPPEAGPAAQTAPIQRMSPAQP